MAAPNVVVLLTACIDPKGTIAVRRNDVRTRLEDYEKSLRSWLADPAVRSLIFCESSNNDLAEIKEVCKEFDLRDKDIELLSFDGQSFPPQLGKGYGEMNILAYAMRASRLIQKDTKIIKVTGRLYVSNAAKLIDEIRRCGDWDVLCDLRGNLTWADSRVFCATPRFISEYLIPMREIVNDSAGSNFETALGRAVHQCMAHGCRWSLLPNSPNIVGISGTSNAVYPNTVFSQTKRELFRRLKKAALGR